MDKKNLISWLSPTGDFFPVELHIKFAREMSNLKEYEDAYHYMFKSGWLRVIYSSGNLYCDNPVRLYNSKQKTSLIDLAIFTNMKTILYDNGNKVNVIWEKDDA